MSDVLCQSGAAATGVSTIADLAQIIYASQPFGYDAGILSCILMDARRLNARDDVTGALVCRQDIYLQLLEGPSVAVEAAFARICRDDRHVAVCVLVSHPVQNRLFGNWAMLHDPAESWFWDQEELDRQQLELATTAEVCGLFAALADRVKRGEVE